MNDDRNLVPQDDDRPPFTRGDLELIEDTGADLADAGDDYLDLFGDDDGAGEVREIAEHADDGEVAEQAGQPLDERYQPPEVKGIAWDAEQLRPLLDVAARHGVSADTATAVLSAYGREMTEIVRRRIADDGGARQELMESLRDDWGSGFAENKAYAKAVLKSLPNKFREALQSSRTYDGLGGLLIHEPAINQLLAELGRLRARGQAPKHGKARLAEIDEILRTDPDKYWRLDLGREKQRLLAQGVGR